MLNKLPSLWFESYTSFQAEFGLKIISKIDSIDKKRINNVNLIKSKALNVNFPKGTIGSKNVYWNLIAYFNQIEKVQKYFPNGLGISRQSMTFH